MSRFLKKRHYKLVLPGIRRLEQGTEEESLQEIILWYMNKTQVSFTQQDVAEIQTMYLAKYGQEAPPPPPSLSHTPNILGDS
jgi:hypothetical protein